MFKTLALASAAALAFAGAASAQQTMPNGLMPSGSMSNGSMHGGAMPGGSMRGGPMHGGAMGGGDMATTHDFVMKAAASDKFEVTEGRMAASMAKSPDLRRFGSMMVRDHTKSTMKIKAAVRSSMGHNPPPPMLMSEQKTMVADLRATHGRDFDRTYVDQQLQAHQMALDLMTNYANSGSDPALKQAASEIMPVVQRHLDMLHEMQGRMH